MTDLLITQTNLAPDFIDLGLGIPDLFLLPLEIIRQSAEAYFSAGDLRSLQYGKEQGDGYFRLSLANFLANEFDTPVEAENLLITSGASNAIDLLCTLFTRPGDVILVEEPTYFLALRIFEEHGLIVKTIAMDSNGLEIEGLEEKVSKLHPKFIYIIPTYHNPTGRTLSNSRREALVNLAEKFNFLILADEVYHFLSYDHGQPKPFASYSKEVKQVISVNSFSKILAPGLRLGWIQANIEVINRLVASGQLDSGGGLSPFTSALVRELIEIGDLKANITKLRKEYGDRRNVMNFALQKHMPNAEYIIPQGGFFFWVRLADIKIRNFRISANNYNVDVRQGELFSRRGEMQDYMRLGFCYYDGDLIIEGIRRIKQCLKSSLF